MDDGGKWPRVHKLGQSDLQSSDCNGGTESGSVDLNPARRCRAHRSKTIQALLEWVLDETGLANEDRAECTQAVLSLWDLHADVVLRAAAGSRRRARRVVDSLLSAIQDVAAVSVRRAYLRPLRQAVTGRDPVLRMSALTILLMLKRRYRCDPGSSCMASRFDVYERNRPGERHS